MQKKRFFSVLILGLFLTIVLVQFIHLASADTLSDFFTGNWDQIIQAFQTGKGISEQLARIIFFVIILLLVYSVLDKIPALSGGSKNWVRVVMSVAIAFLSTAYLQSGDIMAILLSYSGLGFTFGIIVPFLVLIFFSFDIINSKSIHNAFVQKTLMVVIWISFGSWILIRAVTIAGDATVPEYVKPTMWLVALLSLSAAFFAGALVRAVRSGQVKGDVEAVGDTERRAAAVAEARAQTAEREGG